MKAILLIPVLGLTLLSVGCSYDPTTIRAEAPGGIHPQTGAVESGGPYTLYHVTEFDMWGVPQNAQKVATVDLSSNARVGFRYEVPKGGQWDPDAKSEVVAYAGSFSRNLGPVHSITEKYYWANPNEWDGYWASRPERILAKRATMY